MTTKTQHLSYNTEQILLALSTLLLSTGTAERMRVSIEQLYRLYHQHKRLEAPSELLTVTENIIALNDFLKAIEGLTLNEENSSDSFDAEFASVGRKIKALRTISGEDIETVAKAIGIKEQRLDAIECGKCGDMTVSLMEKIAKHFDIPISELVAGIPVAKFTLLAPRQSTKASEDDESDKPSHHDTQML